MGGGGRGGGRGEGQVRRVGGKQHFLVMCNGPSFFISQEVLTFSVSLASMMWYECKAAGAAAGAGTGRGRYGEGLNAVPCRLCNGCVEVAHYSREQPRRNRYRHWRAIQARPSYHDVVECKGAGTGTAGEGRYVE